MQTYITTNERIADLRNMSGLTQKELCDKADIPYSTLSRIERGEITNVSNDILIKLSNFFNVSTDYLLGTSDDPAPAGEQKKEPASEIVDLGDEQLMKAMRGMAELTPERQAVVFALIEALLSERDK